jgi:hypothetical protein
VVLIGAGLGTALVAALAALAVGLSGASFVNGPHWPGSHRNPVVATRPAGEDGTTAGPGGNPTVPTTPAGSTPTPAPSASVSPQPTRRHVPTQTPSHPKPSKS